MALLREALPDLDLSVDREVLVLGHTCDRSDAWRNLNGMPTDDEIEAAARVLLDTASSKPARVYLFGSYARGEAGPHSDLDFLVVEPEVTQRRHETARLRVALPDLNTPVDVVVCSEEEARFWKPSRTHVVGVALAEGRLVAAA